MTRPEVVSWSRDHDHGRCGETMKKMRAGESKARCLRLMEEVKKYRTPVVITKKGRPVAKIVPVDEPADDIFGCMAHREGRRRCRIAGLPGARLESAAVIVLDTHTFAWLMLTPKQLSPAATSAIRAALGSGGIAIASVTAWELAVMGTRGPLVATRLAGGLVTA